MRILLACAVVFGAVAVARSQPPEPLAAPGQAGAATPADMGYALGYRIGEQIAAEHKEMGTPVDFAALAKGLADATTGAKPQLDEAGFRRALAGLEDAMQRQQEAFAARMQAAAKANLEKGRKFHAAQRPAVRGARGGRGTEAVGRPRRDRPLPGHADRRQRVRRHRPQG
jgi:FKBP-type peptidyl-prolyl cis-trans isomerase